MDVCVTVFVQFGLYLLTYMYLCAAAGSVCGRVWTCVYACTNARQSSHCMDDATDRCLASLQEQRLKELSSTPMSISPTQASKAFVTQASPPAVTPTSSAKPSDDLLVLNSNPFADNVQSVMAGAYSTPQAASNPFGGASFQAQQTNGVSAG